MLFILSSGLMVAAWEAAMLYVIAAPGMLAAGAADVARIGSSISAANSAAAQTTEVVAAARDEVSAAISSLFSNYAQFQALSARAAFHTEFVQALNGAGRSRRNRGDPRLRGYRGPGHQFDGRHCHRWCQRALSWFSLRRLWVWRRRLYGYGDVDKS